jgi:hypothetical protein
VFDEWISSDGYNYLDMCFNISAQGLICLKQIVSPFFTPSFLVLLIPLLNLPVVSKKNVDLRIVLSKLF